MRNDLLESRPEAISSLQSAAWAACNASYSQPDGELYRILGRSLYEQDVHERIRALFARGDRQNARLDDLATRAAM
jgi:hypothetical protein